MSTFAGLATELILLAFNIENKRFFLGFEAEKIVLAGAKQMINNARGHGLMLFVQGVKKNGRAINRHGADYCVPFSSPMQNEEARLRLFSNRPHPPQAFICEMNRKKQVFKNQESKRPREQEPRDLGES
jgi:hypothetical protein